ncbi:hypothetical protein Tco_0688257, partial [Tanacetum coccineum]
LAVPTFQQGEDLIDCINKAMAFLSAVASRFPFSNNQLRTSSSPRNQATIQDGRVTVQQVQGRQTQSFAYAGNRGIATTSRGNYAAGQAKEKLILVESQEAGQTEDLDAYDSDCDDISSAKAVLMANLSSCDLDAHSKVPYSNTYPNDMINQDVQEMSYSEQTHIVDFPHNEITSDSDIIPYSQYLQESQDAALSNHVKEKESLSPTLTGFKTESKEKESKYIYKEIVLEKQNKELENILCKLYRSTQAMHMLTKPQVFYDDTHKKALGYQNWFHLKKAQRIQPTLYDGSVIAKKHDVISEIDDKETLILKEEKQPFWLKHSNYNPDTSVKSHTPVRIKAPSELPKVCLVNESLKKLKYHLASFDKVVKKRTTSDAISADTFNPFDKTLLEEITEVKTVFNQIEAAVDQCSVDKNALEIQIKQLCIDNDQLLNQIMSQEIMHIAVNFVDSLDVSNSCVDECHKCLKLETELLKKKYLIRKDVYDKLLKSYTTLEKHCISLELATQLNQEIFQKDNFDSVENVKKDIDEIETINIELEHSVAKLLSENKNLRKEREQLKSIYKDQFDSIKKTRVRSIEHSDSPTAQINAKSVENSDLNAQLQEKVFAIPALKNELRKLKGKNVVDTASSTPIATTIAPGIFKLDIEPISHRLKNNRDAHETCLNLPKPSETLVVVTPLNKEKKRIKCSTGASRSNPSGNTKNNRISQPSCSNKTNKVEDQSRSVKSRKNKKNHVVKIKCNTHVMQSMLNANSQFVCAICNECLFDANHDKYVLDYVHDVNVLTKSKHIKRKNKMRKVWKPMGKVFTEIGYSWKPTGRILTIIGNRCPLTRITSTKELPLKETTTKPVITPSPELKVYSMKPKASISIGSSSKVKIVESKTSNTKEPKQSWGSTISDVPSSSLIDCRFGNDHIAKIMGYRDYQMGNVTISQVYYVEGLGLVQNIPSLTPCVPPTKNDWEISFQPMFDEYLNPPSCVDPQIPAVIAPEPVVSTDKSEIDPLIRESMDTFLMGDEEIELNSHEDIDDHVPIPMVSKEPLDSRDPISKAFNMTINTLFDFDSEFTLNLDNPIFDI